MFLKVIHHCLFINYAYIIRWVRRHLKETVLWGNITWSETGKQNLHNLCTDVPPPSEKNQENRTVCESPSLIAFPFPQNVWESLWLVAMLTRLTTAIHRRLFSRFFSEGGGTSVHRLNIQAKNVYLPAVSVFKVMLTLYRLGFVPARKP